MLLEILGSLLGLFVAVYISLKVFFPWVLYDVIYIRSLLKFLSATGKIMQNGLFLIDVFEEKVMKCPDKIFISFQDRSYTYKDVNERSNRVARSALQIGLKAGDTVALMIYNEPAFIWSYLGFLKIGVRMALINFNLRSRLLVSALKASEATTLILGEGHELLTVVQAIKADIPEMQIYVQGVPNGELPGQIQSFHTIMGSASCDEIPKSHREKIKHKDPAVYIYTSGTTGLPKPCIVSQTRLIHTGCFFRTFGIRPDDIFYITLPLYHSSGLLLGVTVVLRSKFSASKFWEDCRTHKVTIVIYIGEMLRYLHSRPKEETDRQHCIRCAVGNGLRMDIWGEFRSRFQIPNIVEFYAATEGPVGTINLFNKVGAVGRSSPILRKVLPAHFIKYDVARDEPVRDENGRCLAIKPGETGLYVTKLIHRHPFDGYKGKKELTEKKILHDVFEKGDRYYNSGDLMMVDKDYFIYFKDRIGDTFRWKGENVSTTEVSNVIADLDFIQDAVVYGVQIPGCEGRAGMAAINLKQSEVTSLNADHLKAISQQCNDLLPGYARPVFIRVIKNVSLTSTFKQYKLDLSEEGFDKSQILDDMYIYDMKQSEYVELTDTILKSIKEGEIKM
ncbi:hypothetical protein ACJMK2_043414 [Sinanodonta woodiana]|uniref:Very long-chain fatty acid transport protein n=1 Tax=Sinanodonta woodiana TaxID=1069815 RepID=A0ABD3VWU3_SINWO